MWKEFWVKNRNVVMEESSSEEKEEILNQEGLGNQISPKSEVAHKGSDDLENFFSQLER